MEQFENFKNVVEQQIAITNEKLNALQQLKLCLNAEALKTDFSIGISKIKNTSKISTSEFSDMEFPNGTDAPRKLFYLINKEKRALKNSELCDLLFKYDKPSKAKKIQQGIYGHISNLVKNTKAIRCMFGGDKKLAFYLMPEWTEKVGEYRTIKAEFYPSSDVLMGIDESRLLPENIEWSDEPKTNLNPEL